MLSFCSSGFRDPLSVTASLVMVMSTCFGSMSGSAALITTSCAFSNTSTGGCHSTSGPTISRGHGVGTASRSPPSWRRISCTSSSKSDLLIRIMLSPPTFYRAYRPVGNLSVDPGFQRDHPCGSSLQLLPHQIVATAVRDRRLPQPVPDSPPRCQPVIRAVEKMALHNLAHEPKTLAQHSTVRPFCLIP